MEKKHGEGNEESDYIGVLPGFTSSNHVLRQKVGWYLGSLGTQGFRFGTTVC